MRTGTIEVDLNVLPQYTMQLPFAEYYHVVQALPDAQIRGSVRRWSSDWESVAGSSRHRCSVPSATASNLLPELVIVVSDEVLRSVTVRRGLPELLGRPGVGRAAGHIEVNDFARVSNSWTTKKNAKIGTEQSTS